MSDHLHAEDHAHPDGVVRVLRLHRPQRLHALDTALLGALADALHDAATARGVTGVLLTGDGNAFSAGADLDEELPDGGVRRMELFTALFESLSTFALPTAAAVEGPAVGGGAELAAACDVRVAGTSAVFRFPGVIHGVPVGAARLVGLVGLGVAKDWVMSGRDVAASEARAAGLVQSLVVDGDARRAALDWLTTVGGRDRATVAAVKRMLNDFEGVRDRVAFENDALRAHVAAVGAPMPPPPGPARTPRPRRTG